jgi:hypothetical protein
MILVVPNAFPAEALMTKAIRRTATALAALVVLSPFLSAGGADGPPKDVFVDVDLAFREFYAQDRAEILAKIGPTILVEMDSLVLLRNGTRTESVAIPPIYHRLKAVSHVPLALYVALAPFKDGSVSEDRLGRLKAFRARIDEVSNALEGSGFSPEQVERSRPLLRRSAAFLDEVLKTGRCEPAALKALTRDAAPVVLANVADSVKAQVDAYHAQVSAWRRQMPEAEWSGLHVVVLGPQMPRRRNVAVQYFAKLMGLPGEGRRLVYAEVLSGEQQALNLLATHRLDSELAVAFFGDPERMEIDLLGNAAATYLDAFDFDR